MSETNHAPTPREANEALEWGAVALDSMANRWKRSDEETAMAADDLRELATVLRALKSAPSSQVPHE